MASHNPVPKLYRSVVEDVISNVREAFLDEGVDEQVLQELKQLWENKLLQSKAVEGIPTEQETPLLQQFAPYQVSTQQVQPKQPQQQQQQLQQQARAAGAQIQAPQIPIFSTAQGTIDLSNAAQAATLALYQQQLSQLPHGTITLQAGQGGPQFVIQAPQQVIQQQGATGYTVAGPEGTAAQVITTQAPQQHQQTVRGVIQLDGVNDTSSDDDDDYKDDDDDDDEDEQNEEENECQGEEEEPLNSEDDISDEDPSELFDTDNVVVCQYDKINRNKNKWKFHLKDGIMNLNGKDYVFQKSNGEAEW